jgi:hypothetical protein
MLIGPSDFGGEYRLFNANNLDPDTIRAIDQAQEELARDLFPVGHTFIIANGPMDPPNLGLRMLGLHKLFVPWVFRRLELGILGAGVKRASDVPGRSRFASGAFFAIAREYRYFLGEWAKYEGYIEAVATSPTLLTVPIVASQIVAPGMEIEIEGIGIYSVVASGTGLLTISPALPAGVTNLRFRQLSLRIDRKWNYL